MRRSSASGMCVVRPTGHTGQGREAAGHQALGLVPALARRITLAIKGGPCDEHTSRRESHGNAQHFEQTVNQQSGAHQQDHRARCYQHHQGSAEVVLFP
jgi:hypothetical protein